MVKTFMKYVSYALKINYNKTLETATAIELYDSMGKAFNACCSDINKETDEKRACYFSAEFLVGRLTISNFYNLGILADVESLLNEHKRSFDEFQDFEDLGLGNGGLGRLAAGFLDSAASLDIPLDGFGIRYKYGYFKQKIIDNCQKEFADDWLDFSDAFGQRCESEKVTISFRNENVFAVPYIYYIPGYKNHRMNKLYLFQAEAENGFDYEIFNTGDYNDAFGQDNSAEAITATLYPDDSTEKGKMLRLKQQYFFTSAALQILIKQHLKKGKSIDTLNESIVIQLNDTHPTIAIPECIRIVMTMNKSFEEAFEICKKIFAYTNHTVMAEALEKWDEKLLLSVVPQIYEIIRLIDEKLKNDLKNLNINDDSCYIINNSIIHMANLACYVCFSINGVAKIHTNIIKKNTLNQWYKLYPDKFNNKTNGVTQRRWLAISNPKLDDLLKQTVGETYLSDFDSIKEIEKQRSNKDFLMKLKDIKYSNKLSLADYILSKENVQINPDFVFCTQIKRLHEYKRQLMNIFSIIHIYLKLKDGELRSFIPTLFIIGAKAAPGYRMAKRIIEFINIVSNKINADEQTKDRLQVIFVQNYNVSYAEKIIPATDISEQISLASKEASGTSNMKFMMNGAVTLGTYDGANIEIVEKAGEENNFIFGMRENEVAKLKPVYDPINEYESNNEVKRVVDTLIDNTFLSKDDEPFNDIYASLMDSDEYMVLKDLPDYINKKLEAISEYSSILDFTEKSLMNIANSSDFSCDRTIRQYADEIWFKNSITEAQEAQ